MSLTLPLTALGERRTEDIHESKGSLELGDHINLGKQRTPQILLCDFWDSGQIKSVLHVENTNIVVRRFGGFGFFKKPKKGAGHRGYRNGSRRKRDAGNGTNVDGFKLHSSE